MMAIGTAVPRTTGARAVAPPRGFYLRVNYQQLRHGRAARWLRALMYRALVGREGWPLVFRAPDSDDQIPLGASPHLYVHLPFCRQICPHCPYTKTLYRQGLHRDY